APASDPVAPEAVTRGAYTVNSLHYERQQCRAHMADRDDPLTPQIFASTYGPAKTEMQGKALAFLLAQINMMRTNGVVEANALRASIREFQQVKNDCQNPQTSHRVAPAMFDEAVSKPDEQRGPAP